MVPKKVSYRFPGIDYCIVSLQRAKVPIPRNNTDPDKQTDLGLRFSSTGHFNLAINEVKEKARRAFSALKKNLAQNIPISNRTNRIIWQRSLASARTKSF